VDGIVARVESDLIGYLESLPRQYAVCFELPAFQKYGVARTEVANGVSLIETTIGFDEALLEPQNSLLVALGNSSDRLRRNTTYVVFQSPGFASSSIDSFSVATAVARVKHFAYLGAADNRLNIQRGLADIMFEHRTGVAPPMADAFVYNPSDIAREAYRLRVPDGLSKYLRQIRMNEKELMIHDGKGASSALLGRPAESPAEKIAAMPHTLFATRPFFDIPDGEMDAERIRAAIEWYVDSVTTDNHTIAFLQSCIGLEALLSDDKDKRGGVTNKLCDRLTYLLGRTISERRELRDNFEKIYDHRGSIVHGRRARLGADDTVAMVNARHMLDRCIRTEVAGLLKAIRLREEAAKNSS